MRLAHGRRRPPTRAISTHSDTVTGKLQLIVSTCGTYAIRRPARRRTLPCAGRMLPAITRSAVVLPAPEGPTIPTNSPVVDREIDVDEHRLVEVAAGDAREREQFVVLAAGAHCGYVALSGATSPGSNAFRALASPPIASVIVT